MFIKPIKALKFRGFVPLDSQNGFAPDPLEDLRPSDLYIVVRPLTSIPGPAHDYDGNDNQGCTY
jgi:hypothetical protein